VAGGVGGVEGKAHPLEEGDAGFAVAIDLNEAGGGAMVAGGVEDGFRGEAEMDAGGIRPGLGGDFVAHVGAGVGAGGGALGGEHGGKMAGFMEQVAGMEETFGVDDEAAGLERDAGLEGVWAVGRETDGEAEVAEPFDDLVGDGVEHGESVEQGSGNRD